MCVHVVYYFVNKTCGAVCDAIQHVHSNKADPNQIIFSECLQQDMSGPLTFLPQHDTRFL